MAHWVVMLRRTLLGALLLVTVLAASRPSAADPEDARRLRHLGHPEHEGYAAALAWWEEQDPAERVRILRHALASEDVGLATLAAEAIGAEYLDAAELRRKMDLLLEAPSSVFQSPTQRHDWALGQDLRPWGGPDLVPFFRRAVRDDTGELGDLSLDSWHRVLRPEHVEGLVPLLDEGDPAVFRAVLWHVLMAGEYDREDRHRETIARGMHHALQRLRAEREEQPVPGLDEGVPLETATAPSGGLPGVFVELMRAYWPSRGLWHLRLDEDGPPSDVEIRGAYFWLRRWTLDLVPAVGDLPFLVWLAEDTETTDTAVLRWALGHLATLSDEGRARVRGWAEGDDILAAHAAAALAEHGQPARFFALLADGDAAGDEDDAGVRASLEDLLWFVDRERARARWVEEVLADPAGLGEDGSGLGAEARWLKERFDGIVVAEGDLEAIADALWAQGAPTATLAWFYSAVWPEGLTTSRMDALLARLRDLSPFREDEGRWLGAWLPLLAAVEVRDEARLRDLLRRWVDTQPEDRQDVLGWLARLGDTHHAAAMIDAWAEWEPWERWVLGLVDDDGVRAFLRREALVEDVERAGSAMLALAVAAGLPIPCTTHLSWGWREEDARPLLDEVRRGLEGGDVDGALRLAAGDASPRFLGLLGDPAARPTLERFRDERHLGSYREAVLGLAALGDPSAVRELEAFLEDDRIWLIENLDDEAFAPLPEPFRSEHWLPRLDTNCCLGWRSMVALHAVYPTLPFDDGYGGAGTSRTRSWMAGRTWAWSRLLGGWVPKGP